MPTQILGYDVTLGDWLTIIGFLFTGVGLIFAGYQFRQTNKAQRATFLLDTIKHFFDDDAIRELYYALDWSKKVEVTGRDEQAMDELLYILDLIGRLLRLGVLKIDEVDIIAFQILRIMKNPNVEAYLTFLDNEFPIEGIKKAHSDARFLVERLRKRFPIPVEAQAKP